MFDPCVVRNTCISLTRRELIVHTMRNGLIVKVSQCADMDDNDDEKSAIYLTSGINDDVEELVEEVVGFIQFHKGRIRLCCCEIK